MALSFTGFALRPDVSPIPLIGEPDPGTAFPTYQGVTRSDVNPYGGGGLWIESASTINSLSFRAKWSLENHRDHLFVMYYDDLLSTYNLLETSHSTTEDPFGENPDGVGITGISDGWVDVTVTGAFPPGAVTYVEIYVEYSDTFLVRQGVQISEVTLNGVTDDLDPATTLWTAYGYFDIFDIDETKILALDAKLWTARGATSFPVGEAWRVRLAASATTSYTGVVWRLQYRVNAGAWQEITDTTPIQYTASAAYDTGWNTTMSIFSATGLTFAMGTSTDTSSSCTFNLAASRRTELEYCFKFDEVQVANGDPDYYELRVVDASNTVLSATWAVLPREAGDRYWGDWYWGSFPNWFSDANYDFDIGSPGEWNGKLYSVSFGWLHSTDIEDYYPMILEYDPVTDVTTHIGGNTSPPAPRIYGGQKCTYEGKIYCFNFYNYSDGSAEGTWIYDITGDTWTEGTAPPAIPNATGTAIQRVRGNGTPEGCAVAYDGKIYLFGGSSRVTVPVTEYRTCQIVHIYDIASNTWTSGAQTMPVDANKWTNEFAHGVAGCGIVSGEQVPVIYLATQFYNAFPWARLLQFDIASQTFTNFGTPNLGDEYQFEFATPLQHPDGSVWLINNDPSLFLTDETTYSSVGSPVYDIIDQTWSEGDAYPWKMTLGQWYEWIQKGWTDQYTRAASTLWDGDQERRLALEFGSSTWGPRTSAVIDHELYFQDFYGHMRRFNPDIAFWEQPLMEPCADVD